MSNGQRHIGLPREVSMVDDMGVVATGKHGQSSVTIKVIIGSLVARSASGVIRPGISANGVIDD